MQLKSRVPLVACGITGAAGGVVLMFAVHASIIFGPVLGAVYGVLFALVFSEPRARSRLGTAVGIGLCAVCSGSPSCPAHR